MNDSPYRHGVDAPRAGQFSGHAERAPRRVALIVRGGWDGHQPVETTELFVPFLEANNFEVHVRDGNEVYADASFMRRVDVIVQCTTMSSISPAACAGLVAAVASGTGLVGWHGGIVDAYRDAADYLHLVGGQFACHPAAPARAGEAPQFAIPHTVSLTEIGRTHPITAGVADFSLTTEQYWVLSDSHNEVLATTTLAAHADTPWRAPVTCPAVWTRSWGAGRVVVATPGHDLEIVRHPSVRSIIERGILWAARHQGAAPVVGCEARLRVGIVGCGAIVAQYLQTLPNLPAVELVAVADLDSERALAVAAAHPGVRALSVDELLGAVDVDIVLNLTIPAAHAEIALRAIAHGKHVYGEKPLATDTRSAQRVLAAAERAGVLVGCAPDTVLGIGVQTARALIESGEIGSLIAASATMVTPGHERWHPNPDFYYQPGGGPLLDMGPYYLTALVQLLGPVVSVSGLHSQLRTERTVQSGPRAGARIPVNTPTHFSGTLRHENGALSTLLMSFDAVASRAHPIEVHGSLGTLAVPDPNQFDGVCRLLRLDGGNEDIDGGWDAVPTLAGIPNAGRGVGLNEFAEAIRAGRTPAASGELAYHVLEVMESLLVSGETGQLLTVDSTWGAA